MHEGKSCNHTTHGGQALGISGRAPSEQAEQLRRLGFEVRNVPNTGHVIHNEDFAGFLRELDTWLAGVGWGWSAAGYWGPRTRGIWPGGA